MYRKVLKIIYNTLVYPNFLYCITAWGNISQTNLKPLVLLQKKIIRTMYGINSFQHTAPLFTNLNILNIEKLFKYMSLIYVYKSVKYLNRCDWFVPVVQSSYNLRNNNHFNLQVLFSRNNQHCEGIRINGSKLWNFLPIDIRVLESYNQFKYYCKIFIMNN